MSMPMKTLLAISEWRGKQTFGMDWKVFGRNEAAARWVPGLYLTRTGMPARRLTSPHLRTSTPVALAHPNLVCVFCFPQTDDITHSLSFQLFSVFNLQGFSLNAQCLSWEIWTAHTQVFVCVRRWVWQIPSTLTYKRIREVRK